MAYFNPQNFITELSSGLTLIAILYIKRKLTKHKKRITSKIVFFVNILLNILLITCLIFPLFILISLFIYESKIDKFFILAVLVNVIIFFLQTGYILYFKFKAYQRKVDHTINTIIQIGEDLNKKIK